MKFDKKGKLVFYSLDDKPSSGFPRYCISDRQGQKIVYEFAYNNSKKIAKLLDMLF